MLERSREERMGGKGVGTHIAEEGLLHTGQLQLTSFEVFMPAWMKCWCWLKQQTRRKTSSRCEKRARWRGGAQRKLGFAVHCNDFGFYTEYFEHGNKFICLMAALAALVAEQLEKECRKGGDRVREGAERPVRKLKWSEGKTLEVESSSSENECCLSLQCSSRIDAEYKYSKVAQCLFG